MLEVKAGLLALGGYGMLGMKHQRPLARLIIKLKREENSYFKYMAGWWGGETRSINQSDRRWSIFVHYAIHTINQIKIYYFPTIIRNDRNESKLKMDSFGCRRTELAQIAAQ